LYPSSAQNLSPFSAILDLNFNGITVIENLQNALTLYKREEELRLMDLMKSHYPELQFRDVGDLFDWLENEKIILANPPLNMPPPG